MSRNGQLCLALVMMVLLVGCRGKSARAPDTLHDLVRKGDLKGIEAALAHGADINARDRFGDTALHVSTSLWHADVPAFLIAKGANLDAQNSEGETALHLAVWTQNDALVRLLVQNGAGLNIVDKYGQTPAVRAMNEGREEMVRFLVSAGADVTLPLAVYLDDLARIRNLLASGADVNARDKDGCTALHWAARLGRTAIATALLEHGADPNARNKGWERTPLAEAAHYGQVNAMKALIAGGANLNPQGGYGPGPLWAAATEGQKGAVEVLLASGVTLNDADGSGCSILNKAVEYSLSPPGPTRSRQLEYKEIALSLLANGAKIGRDAETHGWMLLFAAQYGLKELAERVLGEGNIGINGDKVPLANHIPLLAAISAGHRDVAELLLAAGADVSVRDYAGDTALHVAARGGEMELARLLLDRGARANAQNAEGITPVHEAVRLGHLDMVEFLVARGIDLNIPDSKGDTPLHYAARAHKDITALLLAKGGVLTIKNHAGETPLHDAAVRGNREIVELLLAHGADACAKDNAGRTALDRAQAHGHREVVELLRQYPPKP